MGASDIVEMQTSPVRVAYATGSATGFGPQLVGPVLTGLLPVVLAHLQHSGVVPVMSDRAEP